MPRIDHMDSRSKEYRTWNHMLYRCYNPKDISYSKYGGRGIKVCIRWRKDYLNFLFDMGRKPSIEHSLDRINNNGNYQPSNCRWATRSEQCFNRTLGYKIMPEDARKIHRLAKTGMKIKNIAKIFNIHQCHASRIVSGLRRPLSHI